MLVDNSVEVFVNGQSTGVTIPETGDSHQTATDFTLRSSNTNFISGTNTLQLRWNNSSVGAGGVALAISGQVVPEPSSVAFLGMLGVAGVVRYRRRRNQA